MSETPEVKNLEYDVTTIEPHLSIPLSALMLNTKWSKTIVEAPWQQEQTGQTFFEMEIRRYRLLQNARLCREERQMVLAGTRNDTAHTAIVAQLRSAWDDQDLRERDRGGESFGKGRTVQFAEADTEWYAEQIAHSISGDASELEATWSFDPVEPIWWCGVLDPSIAAPDVMDWSEDWSYSESSPCAEDVFLDQSQVLALTSDDASSPECVQQAEVLVAEANRTLAQARSAMASAKQNRSGFFPPSNVSSSRKGKGKGSSVRSDHFWRQCPERHSKGSGKGNGHWGGALSRVWLLTPMGWISIYTLEAENVPVLAGMILLENHDISFRRNEFLVYDAEGHTRSVPLRRSPSGHRILNLLLKGQRAASCFSYATAGDFIEDPREQNLDVSSACMFGLSQHPFSRVCHHSNPAYVTSHRSWSIPVSTQSVSAVFPHEKLCQPSSLQSKLRPIKTRLSWLQTVIDGQKSRRTLDDMSKSLATMCQPAHGQVPNVVVPTSFVVLCLQEDCGPR